MKKLFTLLISICFANYLISQSCQIICPIPAVNWSATQCEHYENIPVGQDLKTADWIVFPPSSGYSPIAAKINLGHVGPNFSWVKYADFTYVNRPIDNIYILQINNQDYRFSFDIYVKPTKVARIALLDGNFISLAYLVFKSNNVVELQNKNRQILSTFNYTSGSWMNMNFFYHDDGSMEVFKNNYKVANLTGFPTGNATFPSNINFYSNTAGDEFWLGGVCMAEKNGILVNCTQDFNPVCINGTNEGAGSNLCTASVNGYLSSEVHPCNDSGGSGSDPCNDCDECFGYWFDCLDNKKVHFQNNYCNEDLPTIQSGGSKESSAQIDYEWTYTNTNNQTINPEFFNNTNHTSYNPICRFPASGSYTVCLKVYRYQGSGRYLAFSCCYTIIIALPCSSSPTLAIIATNTNSNNEVTFTTSSTNVDNYAWRIDDKDAYINGQSLTGSGFKCKIPSNRNCVSVCLTVNNACGMTSQCITVCKNVPNCGTKPSAPTPITYNVSDNGEVNFANIPDMDGYEWSLPAGCTFINGTTRTSKNPTCKIPDINCFYVFCVKMKIGNCYVFCWCFTIRKGAKTGTIVFDPEEIPCGPDNTSSKIPIRVRGFKNITSLDLTFNINPTDVGYFVDNVFAGPNISQSDIIFAKISNHKMKVAWASGIPVTLADNDILFELAITRSGAANKTAIISIESNTAEVYQNRVPITPTLLTGSFCINGSFNLCGKIHREDNQAVKSVTIELSGPVSASTTTDASGNYCFNSIPAGNYVIKPKKTINPGNGVKINDISDLKAHLLGNYTLPTPYRLIAADVDNNKRIEPTDIARIIPTYIDKNRQFVFVDSWRFIPTSYQFPNALNPFQSSFPEIATVNVTGNMNNIDFVGIKMADLNLDNDPQNLRNDTSTVNHKQKINLRTSAKLDLIIPSDTVRPGSILKIPVYCNGFKDVVSFGFSVNWQSDKLKYIAVNKFNKNLSLDQSSFNLKDASIGKLGIVWYTTNLNGISIADKEALFYLEFEVLGTHDETTKINITGSPTGISFANPTEVIEVNPTGSTILINQSATAVDNNEQDQNELQIKDNPVGDQLNVSWNQSYSSDIILSILDLNGKEIINKKVEEGKSSSEINTVNLVQGVYIISLQSSNKLISKKFIKA